MERLVQTGVVKRGETPRGAVYEFTADREDALKFVKSYHPGTWRRWTSSRGKVMPAAVVELIGKR